MADSVDGSGDRDGTDGPGPASGVTAAGIVAAVHRYAAEMERQQEHLTGLDSAIGDADHGENMRRGMAAVAAAVGQTGQTGQTAGDTDDMVPASEPLQLVARTLISTVGGAAGPLYGTAFLRASGAVTGKLVLDESDVVQALRAAHDGLVARGRAEPGEKTMVDVWAPAVHAAEQARSEGAGLRDVLGRAADAAEAGASATADLVARKGRASYLGDRSVGHIDPGAASSALLFRTLAATPCR